MPVCQEDRPMHLFRFRSVAAWLRPATGLFAGVAFCWLLVRPSLAAPPLEHAVQSAHKQNVLRQDEWDGIYWGAKKIGYTMARISPTTFEGKDAQLESSESTIKFTMLGAAVQQNSSQTTISDLELRPLTERVDVTSNGSTLHVEATYDYPHHKVECTIGSGASAVHKTLTIPEGASLAADTNLLTAGKKLVVGQKISFLYLEPITVELDPGKLEVTAREIVTDGAGNKINAYVVKTHLSTGDMTEWATAEGDIIKGQMDLGIMTLDVVKETKAHALDFSFTASQITNSGTTTLPLDFADATAIIPDHGIAHPRSVRSLRITVAGIPAGNLLPSDSRQKAVPDPGGAPQENGTVQFEITAETPDASDAARLPLNAPELAVYLAKAAYLDTEDPEIKAAAAQIRGNETNTVRIAVAIRDWVHAKMTPDASIAVPRSASDVFRRRKGVCRDFATLYTALARAAGVPTRLCGGIVYADGKFFYHAWAESFVGRWVAFDPTLYDPAHPIAYVDATHIKFAQGDVTKMFNVVNIVGKLHASVQEYN